MKSVKKLYIDKPLKDGVSFSMVATFGIHAGNKPGLETQKLIAQRSGVLYIF